MAKIQRVLMVVCLWSCTVPSNEPKEAELRKPASILTKNEKIPIRLIDQKLEESPLIDPIRFNVLPLSEPFLIYGKLEENLQPQIFKNYDF